MQLKYIGATIVVVVAAAAALININNQHIYLERMYASRYYIEIPKPQSLL